MADTLATLDAQVDRQVFGYEIACTHGENCADIPPYSSDIEAAMLVAERVGGRLELDGYHGQGWTATLRGQRYFAPTPAEAICRAALLAVGAERQGGDDREATT